MNTPGGNFDELCLRIPITRIPIGLQVGLPSCIDYMFQSQDIVRDSCIEWEGAPADHPLIKVSCSVVFKAPRRNKRMWRPDSEESALEFLSRVHMSDDWDLESLHGCLLDLQNACGDHRSCRQRRAERMPAELRDLYQQVHFESNSEVAHCLRNQAWAMRKQWVTDARVRCASRRISESKVLWKPKKLHAIQSLWDSGQRVENPC